MTTPPSGIILYKYQYLMDLLHDKVIDDESTVGTLIGNIPFPGQHSDDFYSKLPINVNKLIKESLQE